MLAILLTILKILLYIVLAVLGLILLFVLIVLFVPIRYNVTGSKYDSISALVKITYLLHLIRVIVDYDGNVARIKVKVLFFTVYKMEKVLKEESDGEELPEVKIDDSEMDVDDLIELWNQEKEAEARKKEGSSVELSEKDEVKKAEKQEFSKEKEPVLKEEKELEKRAETDNKKEKNIKKEKTKKKRRKEKKPKTDKGESNFNKYLEKAKKIYAFLTREENEGLLKFVFYKLWRLLKSVLPKKIKGDLRFGLEEPDKTAYLVGGFSLLYPYTNDKFSLTPDFNKAIIEGSLNFRGRIWIVEILYHLVVIVADKRVRRLIKEVKDLA